MKKSIIYTLKSYLLVLMLVKATTGFGQLVIDDSPVTASCDLGGYGTVVISAPREVLTGDNITLTTVLPGSLPPGSTSSITITRSSNLQFQAQGAVPVAPVPGDPLSHTNVNPIIGNDGQTFDMFYRFPPYITCNGSVGTLTVTVTVDTGNEQLSCTASLSVTGRAANYWTAEKAFVRGNLACGVSVWKLTLTHNNPNPPGLGDYSIGGTFTEDPAMTVVSGATTTIDNLQTTSNGSFPYIVEIQNCGEVGSTLINTADYHFTLGNGCETMTGSVQAESPVLAMPNVAANFEKTVTSANSGPFAPGCIGEYAITVTNLGNVPLADIEITDNINIPGITVDAPNTIATGWTWVNNNGVYTFTKTDGPLPVNGQATFRFRFTINANTPLGTVVSNTAHLSYQPEGFGGGNNPDGGTSGPSPCPGVDCPEIDGTVETDEYTVDFTVEQPAPVPTIRKCIINPPNAVNPPIYQVGDVIHFRLQVGNLGSADMDAVVADALNANGQQLQLIPGSIQYAYYPNHGKITKCSTPLLGTPEQPPFSVVANTADLQHPSWTVTGMPGTCQWNTGNYLVIYFDALILPQLHGNRTNTASLTYDGLVYTSSAAYTINQWGYLDVNKYADAETVESGASFNYIIEVINNGSVPLDNVTVTDPLPDCAVVRGAISVVDDLGNPIAATSSGNLQIQVNATAAIQPGGKFIITVPVTKQGLGTCCNVAVSATGNMVTNGTLLDANDGSEEAPAACVTSTGCCEIPDFDATLVYRNGQYELQLQGGATPIQEVEILMADYHVAYSAADCQPADMGIFGLLTTNTNQLGNLTLQAGSNNSTSLVWSPGSPSVLHTTVQLDVSQPNVLDIECCEVEFAFCLIVRVKDVNCNVCERRICFSPDDAEKPCDIQIEPIGQTEALCADSTITVNWTGGVPSGEVDIILIDGQTGTPYQVVASGVTDNGSYTFTLPAGLPCDPPRPWIVVVKDSHGDCMARSNRFRVVCCQTSDCGCGTWLDHTVNIFEHEVVPPRDPRQRINVSPDAGYQVDCGDKIRLRRHKTYVFNAPAYACAPEGCEVSFQWQITRPDGTTLSGSGSSVSHYFDWVGRYHITFTPICGGQQCDPCTITVDIPRDVITVDDEATPGFAIDRDR
ncbi:hypothetical protein [Parapedobacter sp. 2B3]|uniref:hypothetical protein n=1 Tax=Parapedobacter sp. 2B3 TaxID=3342381 RepID=UPI0035B62FF7